MVPATDQHARRFACGARRVWLICIDDTHVALLAPNIAAKPRTLYICLHEPHVFRLLRALRSANPSGSRRVRVLDAMSIDGAELIQALKQG